MLKTNRPATVLWMTFVLGAALLCTAARAQNSWNDYTEFMARYKTFSEQREKLLNQPHQAKFRGVFQYKEDSCDSEASACICPAGNQKLECIAFAKAIMEPDPNDLGGKAYVLLYASVNGESLSIYVNNSWLPMSALRQEAASFVVPVLGRSHVFNIPAPNAADLARQCSSGDQTYFVFGLAYGAAMPMDQEFARRAKQKYAEYGKEFNENSYLWSVAKLNGYRPKKYGEIGTVRCGGKVIPRTDGQY